MKENKVSKMNEEEKFKKQLIKKLDSAIELSKGFKCNCYSSLLSIKEWAGK